MSFPLSSKLVKTIHIHFFSNRIDPSLRNCCISYLLQLSTLLLKIQFFLPSPKQVCIRFFSAFPAFLKVLLTACLCFLSLHSFLNPLNLTALPSATTQLANSWSDWLVTTFWNSFLLWFPSIQVVPFLKHKSDLSTPLLNAFNDFPWFFE